MRRAGHAQLNDWVRRYCVWNEIEAYLQVLGGRRSFCTFAIIVCIHRGVRLNNGIALCKVDVVENVLYAAPALSSCTP